jgi:hypothetical protein
VSPSDDFEPDLPGADGRPGADPLGEIEIRPEAGPADPASARSLFSGPSAETDAEELEPPLRAAPLSARLAAGATDGAMSALPAVVALLSAAAAARTAPNVSGWIWTGAFAGLLSFFLTVSTLVLFGRTPGMAVAELSCETAEGSRPDVASAVRRWLAGAATILLAGLPLLSILWDRQGRTPADLFSRCSLKPDPTGPVS